MTKQSDEDALLRLKNFTEMFSFVADTEESVKTGMSIKRGISASKKELEVVQGELLEEKTKLEKVKDKISETDGLLQAKLKADDKKVSDNRAENTKVLDADKVKSEKEKDIMRKETEGFKKKLNMSIAKKKAEAGDWERKIAGLKEMYRDAKEMVEEELEKV